MKRLLFSILFFMLLFNGRHHASAAINHTPHDFSGVAGSGSDSGKRGLCETCHVPHAASSSTGKRLWRTNVPIATDTGTWDKSVVGYLCGTCHYSAVAIIAYKNAAGQPPHIVDATVYAAISHRRTLATLVGDIRDTAADTNRPYMNKTYIECTSCHNPHDDTLRPFMRTIGSENTISKVCAGCHDRYNQAVGPDNTVATSLNGPRSMHPVDISYQDQSGNSGIAQFKEPDASVVTNNVGTNMKNAVTATAWVLGGKFQTPGAVVASSGYTVVGSGYQIGCQTCHSIHAPAATPDNSQALYLLAIGNTPSLTNEGSPLCEGCHGGGFGGIVSGMYVGAPIVAGATDPLDDHPIDIRPDGVPRLEDWGSTNRFERVPSGSFTAWPYAESSDPNAYKPVNTAHLGAFGIGRIVCTSCHSAHNAIANTSLNRSNDQHASTRLKLAGAGLPEGGWCFSCHSYTDTVPGNHHSTTYDLSPLSGGKGGNWDSSKVQCADCHVATGTQPNAHYGFFKLIDGNAASELCLTCHVTSGNTRQDPVSNNKLSGPANVPNAHLTMVANAATHYIGAFANGANGINVKTGYWMAAVKNNRGASYSKYGGGDDTHNSSPPQITSNSTIICESCHSVLYNCGDGSLSGGYMVNLLLQNYEDNRAGATDGSVIGTHVDDGAPGSGINVGSGLCIGCHNNSQNTGGMGASDGFVAHSAVSNPANCPPNMHPMRGWTVSRAADSGRNPATLITGSGSFADQVSPGAAPNAASYDGTNMLSCDGCHRPHLADPNGQWKPGYKASSVSVILEPSGLPPGGDYYPLCEQCHSK